jgi:Fic family protein
MSSYQIEIKEKLPKVYSKSLVEHLFKHPYTKIESLENDLGIHRQTASIYLNKLCQIGILKKMKLWKNNYYLNEELYNLLKDKNA